LKHPINQTFYSLLTVAAVIVIVIVFAVIVTIQAHDHIQENFNFARVAQLTFTTK